MLLCVAMMPSVPFLIDVVDNLMTSNISQSVRHDVSASVAAPHLTYALCGYYDQSRGTRTICSLMNEWNTTHTTRRHKIAPGV